MPVIKKRLQVQAAGRRGIDRSLNFVIGSLPENERKNLRGVVFHVQSRVDATRMMNELRRYAEQAVADGTTAAFLDSLASRAPNRKEYGPFFHEFAEEWLKTCVRGSSLSDSERESCESTVKLHLNPAFGNLPLVEVDVRRVDRFKADKRKQEHQFRTGYRAKTINNHLSVLHRIFEKAIEYGLAEKNPVTKRSWMKRESSEDARAWWTPEEEARAVQTLEGWKLNAPGDRMTLLVQICTGIRFSELRALRKSDVDLATPGIHIRRSMVRKNEGPTKNKKARFQVLPRALADDLHEYMLGIDGERLFPGRGGGAISNNVLNRMFARLCAEAGVKTITSHGARHTAGSSYAHLGAGNKGIATLLGHANMASTERYTHMRAEGMQSMVEARWRKVSRPSSKDAGLDA